MRRFNLTAVALLLSLVASAAFVGGCLDPHDTHVDAPVTPAS
jgi:hypothetical protein